MSIKYQIVFPMRLFGHLSSSSRAVTVASLLLMCSDGSITVEGWVHGGGCRRSPSGKPCAVVRSMSSLDDADYRMDGYYPGQYLINLDREKLAFDELFIARSNQLVMYLPNLGEGRDNPTSDSVLKFCIRRERNFLVADWFGRGDSTGKLMSATLTRWKTDVITLLDNVPTHVRPSPGKADFKKAVLVGNGVGVWVAVLVALDRPDLVRGIVGIGGDPDFTEVWYGLIFT
jgi:hypothetical protein